MLTVNINTVIDVVCTVHPRITWPTFAAIAIDTIDAFSIILARFIGTVIVVNVTQLAFESSWAYALVSRHSVYADSVVVTGAAQTLVDICFTKAPSVPG